MNKMQDYPNCNAQDSWWWIGDGICHGGDYNTVECGFDGGDYEDFNNKYPNCNVEGPSYIGNGYCNGGSYNTAECEFDGGDCDFFNNKYPNCNADDPWRIGDGSCFGGDYNTAECGFDGGDCDAFNKGGAPVLLIVGGVVGGVLFLFIAIGIVICKMKRNASTKHLQEVVAGGGAGVQTGNANYDRNNQQETFSVQPSAVPVYASEAAPTTKPTAFCATNCGTANSKGAFCTGCGVPN
jgi:hypothetical protein